MINGHSPVKSPTEPDGPIEDFSLEFMNLYRQPERPSTDSNSYTDLRVANDIASWLNDRDELAEATNGMTPGEVFQRIEQSIEDMEKSHAPTISIQPEEDTSIQAHGLHPQWHLLVVESPVATGGFIGELKGRIGRRPDYYSDPANRWDLLRHPEPFVFFPPYLPIYIDTRYEGTLLRYARRSCNPNMVMKILTQGPESGCHFSFLATRDIDAGEELTVGWDIDPAIQQHLQKAVTNGDIKKEGFKKIQPWVACVLANFGGCACDTSTGYECLLERARRNATTYAEPQSLKNTKGRKTKKGQTSPLSTGHATNSRAGSEAIHRDAPDDDNMDGRSTSGSHKSSSRDITPATHFSLDDSNAKMSERERRKLQQQERLFEQLEEEQHKGKRGKRNSAGSTLNTPSLSTSVRRASQVSFSGADPKTQKQLGQAEHSPSLRNPREHGNGVARKTSGSSTKTNGRVATKPKPVYVNSSTQTEGDTGSAGFPTPLQARIIRPPVSFKRKLLLQAQEDKLQRERIRSASVKLEIKSPALVDVVSSKPSPVRSKAPSEGPSAMDITTDSAVDVPQETKEPVVEKLSPVATADVEMQDAEEATEPAPSSPKVEEMPDAPSEVTTSETSHDPIQPPPPPWPSSVSETQATPDAVVPPQKPVGMRLEMPTQVNFMDATPSVNSAMTPDSASGPMTASTIAQSPVGIPFPSPFSPAVTNAVTPGPARKKLSLSAYTSRRAKLAQQTSHPGSTPSLPNAQSTSSPTLTNTSLPNDASPEAKGAEASVPHVPEERPLSPPTATPTLPTSMSG
jgi:hypothetical protein